MIHTAIETCLFTDIEILKSISPYVDLFIADMKLFDQDAHRRFTGKSNIIIKQNLRYLLESGKSVIVRIPLVKDITDTVNNKEEITKFVHGINPSVTIEFIPFNPLAGNNYARLDLPFLTANKY